MNIKIKIWPFALFGALIYLFGSVGCYQDNDGDMCGLLLIIGLFLLTISATSFRITKLSEKGGASSKKLRSKVMGISTLFLLLLFLAYNEVIVALLIAWALWLFLKGNLSK